MSPQSISRKRNPFGLSSSSRVAVRLGLLAIFVTFAPVTGAGEREGKFGVDLIVGHDANPLLLPADEPSATYTELRTSLSGAAELDARFQLFGSLDGLVRRHDGDASDADRSRASAEAGGAWIPVRGPRRTLSLAVGGRYAIDRSTFVDPVTGAPYEVLVASPGGTTAVPIEDRFDRDTDAVFVDLRWRVHPGLRVSLETESSRARYTEDYVTTAGLLSLDHDSRTVRPGVLFRAGGFVWIDLAYERTERDYLAQTARDASGTEIPNVLRAFAYDGFRAQVRLRPRTRWNFATGVHETRRSDDRAGYYDTSSTTTFATFSRRFGRAQRVSVSAIHRELGYDRATVRNLPDGELRGSELTRFAVRYDRALTPRLGLVVEAGHQDSNDEDPIYGYDRGWLSSGLRFRL